MRVLEVTLHTGYDERTAESPLQRSQFDHARTEWIRSTGSHRYCGMLVVYGYPMQLWDKM